MSLLPKSRPSPAEGELLFTWDPQPLEEAATAYAGLPVFVQAVRFLDVGGLRAAALAPETAAGVMPYRPP